MSKKDSAFRANLEIIESCLHRLETFGTRVSYHAGQTIASIGDCCNFAYIIKDGNICTIRYTTNGARRVFWNSNQTPEDDPIVLAAATLTQQPLLVNVVSVTDSTLIELSREALLNAMQSDAIIGTGVSLIQCMRFMEVKGNLYASEELSFEPRFYELLLRLAQEVGEDYEGKILLRIKTSQQSMADILRADRTTVARAVKRLKDENLLERVNDYYCIKNIKALKNKYESLIDLWE